MRRIAVPTMLAAVAALLSACGGEANDVVTSGAPSVRQGPFDDVSVAAREAAATGKPVELRKLRTENSKTFIRPDGQTLIERTDAQGRVTQEVRNTAPSVNHDQRWTPMQCGGGGIPAATSLTPTFIVSAQDVDSRVHGSRVRVRFEVWESPEWTEKGLSEEPDAPVVVGTSDWALPNAPVSWTVPAGKLKDHQDYSWTARAEDGTTSSAEPSWGFHSFGTDTGGTPADGLCPRGFVYFTDPGTALDQLATAHPDLYRDGGAADAGPYLAAVQRRGMSVEESLAAARAEGERAILNGPRGNSTDQDLREAAAMLEVELARFSRAQVDRALNDLWERQEPKHPTLPFMAEITTSGAQNGIEVAVRNATDADRQKFRNLYGEVVTVKALTPEDPWTGAELEESRSDIEARMNRHDPTLPRVLEVFNPDWEFITYVKVQDLSDPRVADLRKRYGSKIRVDDGSNPPPAG